MCVCVCSIYVQASPSLPSLDSAPVLPSPTKQHTSAHIADVDDADDAEEATSPAVGAKARSRAATTDILEMHSSPEAKKMKQRVRISLPCFSVCLSCCLCCDCGGGLYVCVCVCVCVCSV